MFNKDLHTSFPIIPDTKVYQVGGVVRDRLLNLPVKDIDWVVVGATPKQMLKRGYQQVGKDFPVFLHPKTHEEFALARTERKTALGYHGFEFNTSPKVTLEEDLARRDLTINAMALSANGDIIDPYQGQQDLKNKYLRHVSNAFCEDPVRILRIARFAARYAHLGFQVAPETVDLMKSMVKNGEVDALSPERVFQEFCGALKEKSPQVFLETLRTCHALKVIFPEIDQLFGIPNPPQWHPEIDTGVHTLKVLQQCSLLTPDPMVRFASICHDLGKGLTLKQYWPSHRGHEKKGVPVVTKLCHRLRVPKQWRELAELCCEYHIHTHKLSEMKASTIVKTLEKMDAFRRPERFLQYLIVCESDSKGRTGWETKPYPQKAYFQTLQQAASQIDTQQIAKECDNPKEISQQIHEARVNALHLIHKHGQPSGQH